MSVEDELAERVRKRHAGTVAERVRKQYAGTAAERARKQYAGTAAERVHKRYMEIPAGCVRRQSGWQIRERSGERFAKQIRSGTAFAERFLSGGSMRFAARVLERSPSSGAGAFSGTPLILFKQQIKAASDRYFYRLLLSVSQTWQKGNGWKEKGVRYRDALAQSIVKRMERILKPSEVWRGQLNVHKELTVFRDIATIFVNRGSRPDLAKKAERDLVKILSREYRERDPAGKESEKHVYQRQITHEELVTTRRTVVDLEEQIKRQKTLLLQLQKNMETAVRTPEPDMGKITEEVMKRMEREMHLERLRRGL